MNEWISVKDRLPEVRIGQTWRGLAANAERQEVFQLAEFLISHEDFYRHTVDYKWHTEYGDAPEGYITHWMPIPKSPKAKP